MIKHAWGGTVYTNVITDRFITVHLFYNKCCFVFLQERQASSSPNVKKIVKKFRPVRRGVAQVALCHPHVRKVYFYT